MAVRRPIGRNRRTRGPILARAILMEPNRRKISRRRMETNRTKTNQSLAQAIPAGAERCRISHRLSGKTTTRIFPADDPPPAPQPPSAPASPAPSDGATNVPVGAINLDWGDAARATSYDVYFGTASTLGEEEYQGETASSQRALPALQYDTTYYWQIVANSDAGSTAGPVWSFTTELDSGWRPVGPGFDGDHAHPPYVGALAVYNGELVAGGIFTTTAGIPCNGIARWDGSEWQPLATEIDGPPTPTIRALAVYHGDLIAGGDFSSLDGVECNGIARWDGSNWQAMGTGMVGEPYRDVLALKEHDGELIAGGNFSSAGGVPCNGIARWNGHSWQPLDENIGTLLRSVTALTVYYGDLVVAGRFATGSGPDSHIARWDGSNWELLDEGSNNGYWALSVYDGDLVVGGGCRTADGVTCTYISRWDGSIWQPLGSGTDGAVLALQAYDGNLIAGGAFQTAGGVLCNHIARWNGSVWQPLHAGTDGKVYSLHVYDGDLVVGGWFRTAGNVSSNCIAKWSDGQLPQLPDAPASPNPADGATEFSTDVMLDWRDAARATSYDVYFGTDPTPDSGEYQGETALSQWMLPAPQYDTTYYWKVVAKNAAGSTEGPVWSFTTEAEPLQAPDQPAAPNPAHDATDVPIDADLDWADSARATSYDVYFGTAPSPDSGEYQGRNGREPVDAAGAAIRHNVLLADRREERGGLDRRTGLVVHDSDRASTGRRDCRLGVRRLRPMHRAAAKQRLRSCRCRLGSLPGTKGRRLDRGMGRQ